MDDGYESTQIVFIVLLEKYKKFFFVELARNFFFCKRKLKEFLQLSFMNILCRGI